MIPEAESQTFTSQQLKKQALKEKIEDDVGALVQFLLDEKDDLLERLEAEVVATIGVIDANLKRVESEAAKVDKAITEIQNQLSDSANFEVIKIQSLQDPLYTCLELMLSQYWNLGSDILKMSNFR